MKIIKVLEELNNILNKYGDLEIYLEVNEDIPCDKCGELKSHVYDGFCYIIDTIDLHKSGKCAWFLAKRN